MLKTADFLIIGAGIIGVNIALELKRRYRENKVVIIEKEKNYAKHASGRNSGVLHAGFYYSADSSKARFTREGNRLLTQYCVERGLAINRCGKLVVAKCLRDLSALDELLIRAKSNGVELFKITEKEAKEIEPRVKTFKQALFSPTTSSVNPLEVMASLVADARREGIEICLNTPYIKKVSSDIFTSDGKISVGMVINAAGLYADKIARDFDLSGKYVVLPFKGLYLYSNEPAGSIKTNIYPVPDLRNPFLGVHFTVMVDGRAKIGPTAIPAFWREHYRGFSNFKFDEFTENLAATIKLFLRNDFGFRRLALEELQKYFKTRMVKQASTLVEGVRKEHYLHWARPGIRAQLLNIEEKRLEMDFCVEKTENSVHVLNAVSPAFTCAIPFCRYIVDQI